MSERHTSRTNARAWRRTRTRILDRDGHRCTKCGRHADEVDHITRGAGDHPDNLRAMCAACHKAKTTAETPRRQRATGQHPGLIPRVGGDPLDGKGRMPRG